MWFDQQEALYLRGTTLLGAEGTVASSLRVKNRRLVEIGGAAGKKDTICELDGTLTVPGLINAHDHLDLNSFPRLKWRERYENVRCWFSDFQPRFETDPALAQGLALPIEARLLQGGIKNLLCGATTACHHNPPHLILRRNFPIRVLEHFRFNHSLQMDGEAIARGYSKTPKGWPWIIHAAEGTDEEAQGEFSRLESLGCLGPKTLLVHGVGLSAENVRRLLEKGSALIWCPASNLFLFGATAPIRDLTQSRRLALGTDSRLSGSRDLLEEMKFALSTGLSPAHDIFRMVTSDAASLLHVPSAGALSPGALADLVVFPHSKSDPYESVVATDRASLRLVMTDGCARIGDPDMLPVFAASGVRTEPVMLDNRPKLLDSSLAEIIRRYGIHEPGLQFVG